MHDANAEEDNKHENEKEQKETKISNAKGRIAMLNMNGLKNEMTMKKLRRQMIIHEIDILFITETLGTEDREKEMRRIFKEYDVVYRKRKRKKSKKYAERGGVACIAKKGTVKVEKESEEDDVMYVTWNNIYIACAYLVPPSSPFRSRNEKKMEEIQERLVSIDRCMLLIDANVWIGEEPSVVASLGDGADDAEVTYTRKSEKKEVTNEGREFLEKMNSIDMIVINGIKSGAKYTYDHMGKDAKSVIDFIAVSRNMYNKVSEISYEDNRDKLDTDHILIHVDVERDTELTAQTHTTGRPKPKSKRRKKKSDMNRLKDVRRKDPFWKTLEGVCDKNLQDYTVSKEETVDQAYTTLKDKITSSVTETFKETQPISITLTATLRKTPNISFCRKRRRELFVKMLKDEDGERRKRVKAELSRVGNKLRRLTKKAVNGYKRERVKEIEELEVGDCKRMWKELKKLTQWTRKEEGSETMMNEKKEEVGGEQVKDVWKAAFEKLGVEDVEDSKFDKEFCKDAIERQKELEVESYSLENVQEELDREIEEKETEDAVMRLKSGKAAGCDEVVAEVLKKGGENIVNALHKVCEKV